MLFASPLLQPVLHAQVFEVSGGTSTLYQAGGGSITVHNPTSMVNIGAGTVDGHILGGAQLVKSTPKARYILGDDRINFHLPTDIFDTSHFLLARGIGMSTIGGRYDITAFAGATATDYDSPLFEGAKTDNFAELFFLRRKLGPNLDLFSDTIVSNRVTEIEAFRWMPLPKLKLAASGGVGANQPYGAVSLDFSSKWIDAEGAYIEAGKEFHRLVLVSPQLAEPDRRNIVVTVKPTSFLSFIGAHQNYLVPQYPSVTNVRSSVDEGSANLRIVGTQLDGTIYHSSYESESNHAVSLSATRDFAPRFHMMANYLASRPKHSNATSSFISSVSETLTAHLSVDQSVTLSRGHAGINFGGQFLSNFVSLSADYQTFYVPANNAAPFERALLIDLKMNFFGRLTLHGATFVDPVGHIRDTFDASTLMSREQSEGPLIEHVTIEPAVMRGCIVDEEGSQIEGAALLIDKKLIYTDSSGCFFLRERKPRTHALHIVLTQFLAGGNWYVISAPSTITSYPESEKKETPIVVVLKHVRTEGYEPDAVEAPPSEPMP